MEPIYNPTYNQYRSKTKQHVQKELISLQMIFGLTNNPKHKIHSLTNNSSLF